MSDKPCINKVSGRHCANYEEEEKKYQKAQSDWANDPTNKTAWDTMFILINNAVFNTLNKKLNKCLDKEELEGRALDITMDIMRAIKNKRNQGKEWKVAKVSSITHLFSLSAQKPHLVFTDRCICQSDLIRDTSDEDDETEDIFDCLSSDYIKGQGFYSSNGIAWDWNIDIFKDE